jgi:tetratricopeptide (TPR) repeat protein
MMSLLPIDRANESDTGMNPRSVAQVLQDAVAAHKAGRLDEAERLYRAVLARDQRNFNALHFLAVIAGEAGKLALGIELYRRAASVLPTSVATHANLGGLLRRNGELDLAAASLETALRLDPHHYRAHNSLGLVRVAQFRYADGVSCFAAATRARPKAAEAWHNLASAQHLMGRHEDAITAYRQALAAAPDRIDTRTRLGMALFEMEAYEEALEACRAALAIDANYLPALRGTALVLAKTNVDAALATVTRAIALAPNEAELYDLLGSIHQQSGKFDEAIDAYQTAMGLPGKRTAAYYNFAQCRKFKTGDETVLAPMLEAVRQPGISVDDQCSLHFALGKVLDDLGRYDEAIVHFDEANRAWRTVWSYYRTPAARMAGRKEYAARIDHLIATFDREEIARLRAANCSSDRVIFIVGMMRSGTTLVEQILASHPDVAAGGELLFWTRRTQALAIETGGRLGLDDAASVVRDYLAAVEGLSPGRSRVTDKMPHNFRWLGLIHALLPNARIIHCRRHPLDIALSLYFTRFSARLHEFSYDRDDIVSAFEGYRRVMAHWRSVLPADRFVDVDYEDLVADQESVSRRIVEFCGLEWSDSCLQFHQTERPILTASAWQARQPVYRTSLERWKRYEPWLGALRQLMQQ